jgi:hypothetical protein
MTQAITSAKTSVNQLPAVLRLINKTSRMPAHFWAMTDTVLDYGGGKYDQLTDVLAKMHVRNLIYDPFNRSDDHNACIRQLVEARPADVGICSNVLNVIREPAIRREILENLKRWVDPEGGRIYITVHEGDKSSKGKRTRCGWQSNRPARNYMREIRRVFPNSFGCRWGSKALVIIENWPQKIHGWPHIEGD